METVLKGGVLEKVDNIIQKYNSAIVRVCLSDVEFKCFLFEVDHTNNENVTFGFVERNTQGTYSGCHVTYRDICVQCDPQGEESNGENRICFED